MSWALGSVSEYKCARCGMQVDLEGDNTDMGMRPPADVEAGNGSGSDGAAVGPPTLAQMTNLRKVIWPPLLGQQSLL